MRRLWHRLRREEDGITFVELIVGLVFLGVIAAGFSMVLSSTVRHQREIEEQSTTQAEVRFGLDRLARELRQAFVGGGGWPIEAIAASQITFTTPDRSTPFRLLRVTYRVNGGRLERAFVTSTNTGGPPWTWPGAGTPTSWETVARNITSTAPFTYLDGTDATVSTPSAVRTVAIAFRYATPTGGGRTYSYTSSVSPRVGE